MANGSGASVRKGLCEAIHPQVLRIRSASLRTSFEAATLGGLRRQGNAALKS